MGWPVSQRTVQQLVDAYYEALYRYAYRLTGSVADAEDLTQETFCRAQRHWHQLREQHRVRAWLFGILRNAYRHRLRDQRPQRHVAIDCVGDLPDPGSDPASTPVVEIDPNELQRALDELPEEFRTPIILYYFDNFSYRDIAEQMDLPIGTVMSRLARAKAHLRRLLVPSPVLSEGQRRATDGL
ncbi:MAG: sigma-70 family RNA polymerase sigma factor [Gemmataceae bacterium]|nr:sigma-70 family RNA polymerase sigma factor [Gemmataceae bacterium]MDW8266658.1 sigma-70 family RNA polymerase sigma factor [Gemmataceae bacterium]